MRRAPTTALYRALGWLLCLCLCVPAVSLPLPQGAHAEDAKPAQASKKKKKKKRRKKKARTKTRKKKKKKTARRRPGKKRKPPAREAGVDSEVVREGDTDVKVMEFTGVDIEGRLKSPQMLYFVSRVRAEFDRPELPHRSFMPELSRSVKEESLK